MKRKLIIALAFVLIVAAGGLVLRPQLRRMRIAQWKLEREKHLNEPRTPAFLWNDAEMYVEYGDPDRARLLLEQLRKQFPDSPEAARALPLLDSMTR